MNQTITLQLNNQIAQALQHLAQEKNLSLSEAALYSLHQSFNLPIPKEPEQKKIGNALDHFMGVWTKEEEQEFLATQDIFQATYSNLA